jgi:hypothetical protein
MGVKKYTHFALRFALPNLTNAKTYLREEIKIIRYCSPATDVIFQNSGITLQEG